MEHRSARVADRGDDPGHRKINVAELPGGDLIEPVGPVAIRGNLVVRRAQRGDTVHLVASTTCSAARCRTRPLGHHLLALERSAGWALYCSSVQLGGEPVDLPGQLRVGLEFKLLLGEVVVGLRLLERRLPVLADHHER